MIRTFISHAAVLVLADFTVPGGGEYPTQDGFGWTNGVASAPPERYPDLDPAGARR